MRQGVILYGPPAAGKDTVTGALLKSDARYAPFARLKAGEGRTAGYRMTTAEAIEDLRAKDQVVWENHRYNAVYVVDLPELLKTLASGIPVLHLGQIDAIEAVKAATPNASWLTAFLWCPRDLAEERLFQRGSTDVEARLRAWNETKPFPEADLTINTAEVSPAEAAHLINSALAVLNP